jgi:cellulose synthase/poly-beta-1,6-N-acetylglucosamine synthase-like glycosyltransferase
MHSWEWLLIGLYGIGMLFIFAYSLVQLSLLIAYRRRVGTGANAESAMASTNDFDWPKVLVQLPVYNERYVVSRLIDAAAALDYPGHLLEIQLLDDSTDESFDIAAAKVAVWKSRGINISHVKRPDRIGFKAGALGYGLGLSDAPFVAIFDADFVPDTQFLKRTAPLFAEANTGMVQTRWGHLNRDYSLLTLVQAFALDAHFTVEQVGRNLGRHFINFNGTAGVWRRTCIEDAGGWSADTLTEDLDLSYRAQMRGWRFRYLEGFASPAELPAEMNALKNQQYRWNKGAAECARKHLGSVWRLPNTTLSTKVHASFHLLNSSIFIWIVVCALLSLPLLIFKSAHPAFDRWFHIGGILLFSFVVLAFFYYTAYRKTDPKGGRLRFLWLYPAFLSLSMGMSVHNARAVIQGWFKQSTPFIRTPKWNLVGREGSFGGKRYQNRNIPMLAWIEGIFALYFLGALTYGVLHNEWGFVPLHLMLVFGFSMVFGYTLRHSRE